jgi:predicted RNase H-like HicB family nuclease
MQNDHYRMIVSWSDRDGLWLVEVPELPGAMADGTTPAEAVANAQIIIEQWIRVAKKDGRLVPQPQHYEVPESA